MSKLIPVDCAAWRIAPVICGVAPEAAGLTAIVLRLCEGLGLWVIDATQQGLAGLAEHGRIMVNEL